VFAVTVEEWKKSTMKQIFAIFKVCVLNLCISQIGICELCESENLWFTQQITRAGAQWCEYGIAGRDLIATLFCVRHQSI
jgi:hypothetical protein